MKKQKYDLIVSLGADCACTTYLRRNELQVKSYPFDWLTHATFETRIETLLDDFKTFLSAKNFKSLPKNKNEYNEPKCDYYENTKNGFYFFHDFPIGVPFKDSFPAVKEKYQRRAARLYRDIERAEKVLFVWLSHTERVKDSMAVAMNRKLAQKFGKPVDLLLVENDDSLPLGKYEKKVLSPTVTKYKLLTALHKEGRGLTFLGHQKNCNQVFRLYALREPAYRRWKRVLRKKSLKFVFALIPIKKIRRRLKDRYL